MKNKVIIIGSGLGGLECGVMLSKEGYEVCVLEQAHTLGGCLQSFKRNGHIIDTGMHHIGSMQEGQILNQYFKYFGILEELNYIHLDDNFDNFIFPDASTYSYLTSIERFKSSLIERFSKEKQGIEQFCNKIRSIGESISIDVHKSGHFSVSDISNLSISASEYIKHCTNDTVLQNVLAANNPLYAGVENRSNLYHLSMTSYSHLQGSVRFIGGTQQIADLMVKQIENNGGKVLNNSKVVSLDLVENKITSATLANGEKIEGDYFISSAHPSITFDLFGSTKLIRKAYRSRINSLPNTYGFYTVYLILKKDSVKYTNNNIYCYGINNVWDTLTDPNTLKPNFVFISSQTNNVISLITPIDHSIFDPNRGEDYYKLKDRINNNIIDFVSKYRPDITSNIDRIYSASPLTYADYTGTPDGSAYGLLKDYKTPMTTLLPARTKIPNLLLTGQNLNVHGALGVSISSGITCAELLGQEYLSKKIGNC